MTLKKAFWSEWFKFAAIASEVVKQIFTAQNESILVGFIDELWLIEKKKEKKKKQNDSFFGMITWQNENTKVHTG